MNIVVWGTGGNASSFIKKILPVCAEDIGIKVLSVADDCEAREGSFFCGYKVVHPKNIDISMDIDYVVQLETFGGLDRIKSKELLPDRLRDRLLSLYDFYQLVNSMGLWKNKSVLFIGDIEEYYGYAYGAKYIFKYHEYYSSLDKFTGDIQKFDYIFTCGKWYTSQRQSVQEGKALKKRLIKEYGIDKSRILDSTVWGAYLYSGSCFLNTTGELNPDKKFMVITFEKYIGWGVALILISRQIQHALDKGMIPVVDLKNYRTQYISEEDLGKINVWERFFEPVSEYSLDEVYNSKYVYLSGKYTEDDDISAIDKIVFNEKTLEHFEAERKKLFPSEGKVLGVVYRGTDFNSAFQHPKSLDLDNFINEVDALREKLGYKYIFLATEIDEVTQIFKNRFGADVFFTSQQRYSKDERRFLATVKFDRENDEVQKSIEYLMVLYFLTCCNSVYGIYCGSTKYAHLYKDKFDFCEYVPIVMNIGIRSKMYDTAKKILRKARRSLKLNEYAKKRSL